MDLMGGKESGYRECMGAMCEGAMMEPYVSLREKPFQGGEILEEVQEEVPVQAW